MTIVLILIATLIGNIAAAATCWGEHWWVTVFCFVQAVSNFIVIVDMYYKNQAVKP